MGLPYTISQKEVEDEMIKRGFKYIYERDEKLNRKGILHIIDSLGYRYSIRRNDFVRRKYPKNILGGENIYSLENLKRTIIKHNICAWPVVKSGVIAKSDSIPFICLKCGKEYLTKPFDIFNGQRHCKADKIERLSRRKTKKIKVNEKIIRPEPNIKRVKGGEPEALKWNLFLFPELLSEYDLEKNALPPENIKPNSSKNVFWKCSKCKGSWQAKPSSRIFYFQTGCPFCVASNGEQIIRRFLENNNFNYIFQYKDKRCKDKSVLKFDFLIYRKNDYILLEFNGGQHYFPHAFSKIRDANNDFENIKRRDKIKKDFCKKNNIPLLIIPYWEIDIADSILNEALYA